MLCLKKEQLTGHDVFEFMKGRLVENHWLESSIYLTEDLFQQAELGNILTSSIINFNYYGSTIITESDWKKIKEKAFSIKSETTNTVIKEIDEWAKDCFLSENCFTICGV